MFETETQQLVTHDLRDELCSHPVLASIFHAELLYATTESKRFGSLSGRGEGRRAVKMYMDIIHLSTAVTRKIPSSSECLSPGIPPSPGDTFQHAAPSKPT